MPQPPTEQAVWARLLRWFAIRPRTVRETEQRLRRWGVDQDSAQRLTQRLRDQGLVDDRAFAEAFARELTGKGFRGEVLRARLRTRGVDRATASEAERLATEAAGDDGALTAARRRVRALPTDPEVARRRLVGYLLRKGFGRHEAETAAAQALSER